MKEKRKTRNFRKITPFLRRHRVRRGSCDQKKFLLKFVQRSVLRTCEVWGASEKPFFCNLNTKPRGGHRAPSPLQADQMNIWHSYQYHLKETVLPSNVFVYKICNAAFWLVNKSKQKHSWCNHSLSICLKTEILHCVMT